MGSLCCKLCLERTSEQKNESIPLLPVISEKLASMEWYHGRISDEEADSRMHEIIRAAISKLESRNGKFLVYTSRSGDDGSEPLTLLVYYDKSQFRISIQPSEAYRGMYILGDDGCGLSGYGTVERLIKAAKVQPIRLPNGRKTVLKFTGTLKAGSIHYLRDININELNDKLWYHGDISNEEAKARLREGGSGINGSYLVYNHPHEYGNFVLLVYYERKILRWKIVEKIVHSLEPDDNSEEINYVLEGEDNEDAVKYTTVKELIKAHRGVLGRPIKMDNGQLVTLSKSYVCLVK